MIIEEKKTNINNNKTKTKKISDGDEKDLKSCWRLPTCVEDNGFQMTSEVKGGRAYIFDDERTPYTSWILHLSHSLTRGRA